MSSTPQIDEILAKRYDAGFVTDIEEDRAPPGLNEDIIRFISAKKEEPEWLLEWRMKAYRHWLKMKEPKWAKVDYPEIDYQAITYYSAPKQRPQLDSLDEVDPKLLETYEKLGIPLEEQKMLAGVAVDAVFDSVSVATTFKAELAERASSSAPSPRRSGTTRSSSRSTSAASCPTPTTTSRRSTPPSSRTVASSTSRRASAARWS
jgi:Fe-S cluster assembly protein SufB